MFKKKYKWVKLADSEAGIQWSAEGIGLARFDGKGIAIARFKDKLYGFAQECPHAGADLTEGWIDGHGCVVCPVHGYKFSIQNGRNPDDDGYFLKHWPIEKREDGIYIGIEESGFFSWLR